VSKPIVAIVGRPNVGKSTLFNKLVGKRLAIVEDTPGVTRDRLYYQCEWRARQFMLVDTGGIEPHEDTPMLAMMRAQAQIAIDSADAIVFVTDIRAGVTATDADVAVLLQKSGKPIILCVNKCDTIGEPPPELYEFYNLGLGEPYPVSSVHGHGTGDLLDAVFEHLSFEGEEYDDEYIKVAVVGKPNAGKSSLVNRVAGEERMIVSELPGTTRDATDTIIENEKGKFVFIDTAGIRRKSRVEEAIERYSVLRSYMAVDRADVCVILIDATVGFTEQDSKIAGYAHEQGKASIVAINKWDLLPEILEQQFAVGSRSVNHYNLSGKPDKAMEEYRKKLSADFSFMSYVPYVFISAKTGQRMDKLFELIRTVHEQNLTRISTGRLNDLLAYATSRVQPPTDRGKRLKLYYITQASVKPPTFVVFCNKLDLFHFSYQRYIENQIREAFGLKMTPVKIIPRERGDGS